MNGIETVNGTETETEAETGIEIETGTGIGIENGIEMNAIEMTEGEIRIVTNANVLALAPASDGLRAPRDLLPLQLSIHQHPLQRTRK